MPTPSTYYRVCCTVSASDDTSKLPQKKFHLNPHNIAFKTFHLHSIFLILLAERPLPPLHIKKNKIQNCISFFAYLWHRYYRKILFRNFLCLFYQPDIWVTFFFSSVPTKKKKKSIERENEGYFKLHSLPGAQNGGKNTEKLSMCNRWPTH